MVKCFNLLKADNIQNDFGILICWQRDTASSVRCLDYAGYIRIGIGIFISIMG